MWTIYAFFSQTNKTDRYTSFQSVSVHHRLFFDRHGDSRTSQLLLLKKSCQKKVAGMMMGRMTLPTTAVAAAAAATAAATTAHDTNHLGHTTHIIIARRGMAKAPPPPLLFFSHPVSKDAPCCQIGATRLQWTWRKYRLPTRVARWAISSPKSRFWAIFWSFGR